MRSAESRSSGESAEAAFLRSPGMPRSAASRAGTGGSGCESALRSRVLTERSVASSRASRRRASLSAAWTSGIRPSASARFRRPRRWQTSARPRKSSAACAYARNASVPLSRRPRARPRGRGRPPAAPRSSRGPSAARRPSSPAAPSTRPRRAASSGRHPLVPALEIRDPMGSLGLLELLVELAHLVVVHVAVADRPEVARRGPSSTAACDVGEARAGRRSRPRRGPAGRTPRRPRRAPPPEKPVT